MSVTLEQQLAPRPVDGETVTGLRFRRSDGTWKLSADG
jgi:hypothetical protein